MWFVSGTPCGLLGEMKPASSTVQHKVRQYRVATTPRHQWDELAVEEPLEILVDTVPISVTMRTPGHDAELAAGFLLGEGLIRGPGDILHIAPGKRNLHGNTIEVFLAPDVTVDLKRLRRHGFISSSCGLCGKTSIREVRQRFPKVTSRFAVTHAQLLGLPPSLRAQQSIFTRTGGLHAAGLFDGEGRLLVLREDIGRHNAVDKILGHALVQGWLPLSRHVLLVSGRASFEIVQKALAAGVAVVAAVSAPSSLAVEFAVSSGQTLIGFLREDRFNVYTHPARVLPAHRNRGGRRAGGPASTPPAGPGEAGVPRRKGR